MADEFMRPDDAARFLGVSPAALAKMRSRGTGPQYIKFGQKLVRYRLSDLREWRARGVRQLDPIQLDTGS